jgi:methylenetetrahydrofolate reductase (NADPH)
MRIDDLLEHADRPVFSFEFFPPKTPEGVWNLLDALGALKELEPDFVSVTYGAGGSATQKQQTIDIVTRIKRDFGLEAMAHFTCVGATVEELRTMLDRMREAGIENVLALRGDPPQGQTEWTATEGGLSYSRELIDMIREDYEFAIGAACFPETHIHATSPEDDLRYLGEKVTAGARFLITQLFYDNAAYWDFVRRARDAGIEAPILPGIMPITNVAQIKKITELCGTALPQKLTRELDARAGDAEAVAEFGVAYATLQCTDLLANGAPGVHFYTLNRSPATRAILSALKAFQPWRAPTAA